MPIVSKLVQVNTSDLNSDTGKNFKQAFQKKKTFCLCVTVVFIQNLQEKKIHINHSQQREIVETLTVMFKRMIIMGETFDFVTNVSDINVK